MKIHDVKEKLWDFGTTKFFVFSIVETQIMPCIATRCTKWIVSITIHSGKQRRAIEILHFQLGTTHTHTHTYIYIYIHMYTTISLSLYIYICMHHELQPTTGKLQIPESPDDSVFEKLRCNSSSAMQIIWQSGGPGAVRMLNKGCEFCESKLLKTWNALKICWFQQFLGARSWGFKIGVFFFEAGTFSLLSLNTHDFSNIWWREKGLNDLFKSNDYG